jgi:hypothetical protein
MCRNCYAKAHGYVWQKKYQRENRATITPYNREWAKANPAAIARSKQAWRVKNRDKTRTHLKTWRKKNRAPFCIVCGEDRVAEWAHLIPHNNGGPVAPWNLVPLCPTHHRCLDAGLLTDTEAEVIAPYLDEARLQYKKLSSGALVEAITAITE